MTRQAQILSGVGMLVAVLGCTEQARQDVPITSPSFSLIESEGVDAELGLTLRTSPGDWILCQLPTQPSTPPSRIHTGPTCQTRSAPPHRWR